MGGHFRMATCNCGKVELEARGTPIAATVCHCSGCRQAGHIIESLPDAPRILDDEEGTAFVLYRKDRVTCVRGSEMLAEHRLSETTPTRRIVATCCNSFIFLDFTKGHWISVVRERLKAVPAEAETPQQPRQSTFFVARLILAWIGMGLRTPTIDFVKRKIDNACR